MPAPDRLDDGVRVGGPDERPRSPVVLGEVAVDRLLRRDQRGKLPRRSPLQVSLAKKASTALSHEREAGVKWKVQLGYHPSQARTFGCLWVA
jgi:hypothetical protein